MRARLALLLCLPALLADRTVCAEESEELGAITAEVLLHGQAMEEIRELSTDIGPRMSGTAAYDRAAAWAKKRFESFGLKVQLEPVAMPATWRRGPARVHLVSPVDMELAASSVAFSPPTRGVIRGRLRALADLSPAAIKELAGAVVIADVKAIFKDGFEKGTKRLELAQPLLARAGVKALILPFNSALKAHHHFGAEWIAALPMIDVQGDLGPWLLGQARGAVEVEVSNESVLGPPAKVNHVIAELPGKKPGWVLASAHLDTWDLTAGAQDDAAGVAEVLEAARALALAANRRGAPQRTIRFALFAAEEQSFRGSRAYVEAHARELASCAAVLNTDSGAGELLGFEAGREEVAAALAPLAAKLAGLGASEVSPKSAGNTDAMSFARAGVPVLDLWVDEGKYFDFHHRPTDILENIRPQHVQSAAAAIAAMLWMLAQSPAAAPLAPPGESAKAPGILLERLSWVEAESVLTPESVVVIPLGAHSKEHGPHLRLENDWLIAEYLKGRVLARSPAVVAPTLGTSYYPAFVEYPGSISLRLETARDLIVDTVHSLAKFGPRRFYVLNTGVSTLKPLAAAAEILRREGLVFRYTNLLEALGPVERQVAQQKGGTHADELETSMMLYIAPDSVDMSKAADDFHAGTGPLTRNPKGPGTYSPTGIWGNATLATRAKGERLTEALVAAVLADLEAVRTASVADQSAPRAKRPSQ